jgi:glycosyltransferase involved in cell wall biosynthesis
MVSVLQATAWYPPKHWGGTEVYLTGLVRELHAQKIGSRIIAPLGPEMTDGYEFDGAVVRTYSVNPVPSRAERRCEAPHRGFDRFRQILAEERAEIYHQHSWIRQLGGAHLQAAREAGLKTVVTIHMPNAICLRGTMMRFGREPCDGLIDPPVCAACRCTGYGGPAIVARALGAVPPAISASFERLTPSSRIATALSARALAERRKSEFARMVADADSIVAVSDWVFDALQQNGVPQEKLVLSRQGVDPALAADVSESVARRERDSDGSFRLLYVGRWNPVKGIDVLVRAVRALPKEVRLRLVVHGVTYDDAERDYAAAMRRLAAGDARIAFEPPISRHELAATLSQANALAVPSLWLETGPLVVLEAKAAGLPVIGSRLGGIAELVREPEDGMLVPPGDVRAWTAAIKAMASNRPARTLISQQHSVRTMREVAGDMTALYNSLC